MGEKFVGVLCQQRDGEDFARLDFSEQAWSEGARPPRALLVLGYWRGVVCEGGAKRNPLIDDDSLLDLFDQSDEGEDAGSPARLAFRFVLGLILMRKRLLVHEGSRDGGRLILVRPKGVLRPPEGPALLEIADPGLTPELVAGVTAQLQAVLTDVVAATPAGPAGAGGAA